MTTPQDMEEITQGMMYAALSITDDKPDTLKNVTRMNPWHEQALTMLLGSKERAHEPLSQILREHMGLTLDKNIDVSGLTPGGHFLDSQGYIAHNDTTIVLSYRCTTTAFDWLTNFNTSSSEWEIEEDEAQGFSGFCSGFEGLCCGTRKPRVHTGFYNNFLATLPDIRQYIEPLLKGEDQPPRTLYVTGHSLGAGIATLAACYFLLDYEWTKHSLVSVTAGSPRACGLAMADWIHERLQQETYNVSMHRLVKGKDVVSTVPPQALGFRHVGRVTRLNEDGTIHMASVATVEEVKEDLSLEDEETKQETAEAMHTAIQDSVKSLEEDSDDKQKYDKMVKRIPARLRDHMPDFYLQPLMAKQGMKCGSLQGMPSSLQTVEPPVDAVLEVKAAAAKAVTKKPKKKRFWTLGRKKNVKA